MHIIKRIVRRSGVVVAALAMVGGLTLVDAGPAGAHETTDRVGDAVGTVGAAHSGARLCELSPNRPGIGRMHIITRDLTVEIFSVTDACTTRQYAGHGGVLQWRVGWDQGGGTLWGLFQVA